MRVLPTLLTAAVAAVGCADEDRSRPPASAPVAAALDVFDTRLIGEPAPPDVPQILEVELLEAGAAPRRELRYHMDRGAEHEVIATLKASQTIEMDGNRVMSPSMPPIRLHLKWRPAPDSGAAHYRFEVLTFEAIDYTAFMFVAAADARRTLDQVVGHVFELEVSDTGLVDQQQIAGSLPEVAADEQMMVAQSWTHVLGTLFTPLPDEPVGVGARWRVIYPPEHTGVGLKLKSVYTLVSIEGDRIVLENQVDVEEGGDDAFLGFGGAELEWVSAESEGNGRRDIDLGRLVPVKESSTTQFAMTMKTRQGKSEKQLDLSGVQESAMETP